MKVSIRIRRLAAPEIAPLFATSFVFHLVMLAIMTFLPSFLPAGAARPTVYTVDLVDLPAMTEPAGGAEKPAAAAPARPDPPIEKPVARPKPPPPEPAEPEPTKTPEPERPKPEPPKPPPEKPKPDSAPDTPTPPASSPDPPDLAAAPPTDTSAGETPPSPAGTGAEAPTGRGAAVPGGGTAGPGFDDESFRYAYYATRMVNILRSHWNKPIRPPGAAGTLRAVIFFVIGRDGTILRAELEEPSGYPALDLSALRAVTEARRLPPLPLQYDRNSLGVHFFFELKPEETTDPFGASP